MHPLLDPNATYVALSYHAPAARPQRNVRDSQIHLKFIALLFLLNIISFIIEILIFIVSLLEKWLARKI